MTEYNSEYHYLYSRLYQFRNRPTLSRDEAFLTANIARKLMEAFLSFKFPEARKDLGRLFEIALNRCQATTADTKEKIYRFVNQYSHSDLIEVDEDLAENLMGEVDCVIDSVFAWMEELDPEHCRQMNAAVTR